MDSTSHRESGTPTEAPDRDTDVPDRDVAPAPSPTEATAEASPPPTPDVAARLFEGQLELAERYVALLADTGISHGLVGPRERPRLWDRHVLGCAVVTDVIPTGSEVLDIGSGAGLPGLVMAIRRPDLEVRLVEPLHRRVVWLQGAVQILDLPNVSVHEGRAESCWGGPRVDVVTARAVARIGVLAGWGLPLLRAGGVLVALKGSSAAVEVEEDAVDLRAVGAASWEVTLLGGEVLDPPSTVVTVSVGAREVQPAKRARAGRAGSARRRADRPKR